MLLLCPIQSSFETLDCKFDMHERKPLNKYKRGMTQFGKNQQLD